MSSQIHVDLFLNQLFNQDPNTEKKADSLIRLLASIDAVDYPQLLSEEAQVELIRQQLFHSLLFKLFTVYQTKELYTASPIDETTILKFLLETPITQLCLIEIFKHYQLLGKAKQRDLFIQKVITAAPNSIKALEAYDICKKFIPYDLVPIIKKCAKQHILALELTNKKNDEAMMTSPHVIKFLSKRRSSSCFCFLSKNSNATSQRILATIESGKIDTAENIICAKQDALNKTWHKRMKSY